jgi:superfamily I DNA/RNA helicase
MILSTIHKAKGLGWDTDIILFLVDDFYAKGKEIIEEEKRIQINFHDLLVEFLKIYTVNLKETE